MSSKSCLCCCSYLLLIPALVSPALAETPSAPQLKTGDTAIVLEDGTNLKLGKEVLAVLHKGEKIAVTQVKGDWVGASTTVNGKTVKGWVHLSQVRPDPSSPRTWKDLKGRSIEGTYLGFEEGKVQIQRTKDRKTLRVALQSLSHEDRLWVKSQESLVVGGSKERAGSWRTTRRLLLTAHEFAEAKPNEFSWAARFWLGNDGTRVAYVRKRDGKEQFVLNGKGGKLYDTITIVRVRSSSLSQFSDQVFFGGDQHYVYLASDGSSEFLVVDGKEGKKYRSLWHFGIYLDPKEFLWSHTAVLVNPVRQFVVVNGEEVAQFDAVVRSTEVLLAGNHFLYRGFADVAGAPFFAVYDGKSEKRYGNVDGFTLSASGAYAYLAFSEPGMYYVINGKQTPKFDFVHGLTFSPDCKRSAYWARRDGKVLVIVDDKEYAVSGTTYGIKFSPDGNRWACSVTGSPKITLRDEETRYSVVLDGKVVGSGYEGPPSLVGDLSFSPDSRRFAYRAKKGEKMFLVVDGVEGDRFSSVGRATFSPDGRRLAYVATAEPKGKVFVVTDGIAGKTYEEILGMSFTPDSQHLVYSAILEKQEKHASKGTLVIEGHEQNTFDRISPDDTKLYVGHDRVAYVALWKGDFYWIEEIRQDVAPKDR